MSIMSAPFLSAGTDVIFPSLPIFNALLTVNKNVQSGQ